MDYIALGQRIRVFRRQQCLSQEELAERAEISASFLGHIERGSRIASLETLVRLCTALDVTPNDLLAEECLLAGLDMPECIRISPQEVLKGMALLLRTQGKA